MSDMDAAFRVFTSTLSDDARTVLYDIKERYTISRDDPIWAVLLAIDYHVGLVATIPPELDETARHIVDTLNAVLHEFDTRYNAIEGEIQLGVEKAVHEGIATAMQPYQADLSRVLEAFRGDPVGKVFTPFNQEVKSAAQEAEKTIRSSAKDAMRSIQTYLLDTLSAAFTLRIQLCIAGGILLMLCICAITFALNGRIWSQQDANTTYAEAEHEQMEHENAFYQGLDPESKKVFRQVDQALPQNLRLYYRP